MEGGQPAEVFGQQIVYGYPVLAADTLQLLSDACDRPVEFCIVLGESQFLPKEAVAHARKLLPVTERDESRVPILQGNSTMPHDTGDCFVVRGAHVLLYVCSPIVSHGLLSLFVVTMIMPPHFGAVKVTRRVWDGHAENTQTAGWLSLARVPVSRYSTSPATCLKYFPGGAPSVRRNIAMKPRNHCGFLFSAQRTSPPSVSDSRSAETGGLAT